MAGPKVPTRRAVERRSDAGNPIPDQESLLYGFPHPVGEGGPTKWALALIRSFGFELFEQSDL